MPISLCIRIYTPFLIFLYRNAIQIIFSGFVSMRVNDYKIMFWFNSDMSKQSKYHNVVFCSNLRIGEMYRTKLEVSLICYRKILSMSLFLFLEPFWSQTKLCSSYADGKTRLLEPNILFWRVLFVFFGQILVETTRLF